MSDMNRTAIEEEGLSSVTGGSGDSPARFGAICPACRKPLAGMMYSDWRGGSAPTAAPGSIRKTARCS